MMRWERERSIASETLYGRHMEFKKTTYSSQAAEYIREKILKNVEHEIPHGTAVAIERFREREDAPILDVDATIYCEKASHKGILIGKNGEMLKKISTGARLEMERFFGCKGSLHCWVKVKEDWRNREGLIHNFGLD